MPNKADPQPNFWRCDCATSNIHTTADLRCRKCGCCLGLDNHSVTLGEVWELINEQPKTEAKPDLISVLSSSIYHSTKPLYYYIRCSDNKPIITVALVRVRRLNSPRSHPSSVPTTVLRGVAICSPDDQPNKARGRAMALGRCWRAWEECDKLSTLPTRLDPTNWQLYSKLRANHSPTDAERFVGALVQLGEHKAYANPRLTPFEDKLVHKAWRT